MCSEIPLPILRRECFSLRRSSKGQHLLSQEVMGNTIMHPLGEGNLAFPL
jgi:hypothetical protein